MLARGGLVTQSNWRAVSLIRLLLYELPKVFTTLWSPQRAISSSLQSPNTEVSGQGILIRSLPEYARRWTTRHLPLPACVGVCFQQLGERIRSEEHMSELQSHS